MIRQTLTILAATALFSAARLEGQTIGGVIVDLATKKPLGPARVALIDDSAYVVSTAVSDSTGMFYVDAPSAGRFRVVLFVHGVSYVGPSETLASGQTVEREFRIPSVVLEDETAYFVNDVTKPVAPLRGSGVPRYPNELRSRGIVGTVTVTFVVDTTGKIEIRTVQILHAADPQFADAVQASLPKMRFSPAERDGKHVRQVMQMTIAFGVPGNVPRGDLVITALGFERSIQP